MRGFEVISAYKDDNVIIPKRKTNYSAGYDIAAAVSIVLKPHSVTIIPTGLKAFMQQDEYLAIHIRSGISVKKWLTLINSLGVIDADYYNNPENEGHIMIAVFNHSDKPVSINQGDRIAQGIFCKYLKTDSDQFAECNNRAGGFGSTGI